VRPRHAEDTLASLEIACSRRGAFDHTCEVNAEDKRVRRRGGKPFDQVNVERIDARVTHTDQAPAAGVRDRQVVDRRSFAEALDRECAHAYSFPLRATEHSVFSRPKIARP
jgi:hypothetical protein